MKAVIAMLKHETNTFSPVPTPLERFGKAGPYYGEAARAAYAGTRTAMGAYIQLCEEQCIEYKTALAADARPSGPLTASAYQTLCDVIVDEVRAGCDIVLLDLHGAMVAECTEDGEGTLLKRLRALKHDLPIAVALDMHANMTADIVENSTVIAGYRTYPHTDHHQTGMRAGRMLLDSLSGKIRPLMAWGQLPLMAHTLCMGTESEPFRALMAHAADASATKNILDASVFGGFSLADIERPCLSALVVADGDKFAAQSKLATMLHYAWDQRNAMVYESETLEDSILRAASIERGPVLLIDHTDNCASGGTQDTMHVLREALRRGLTDIAMFAVCDPWAVEQMIKAGVGNTLTLPLGGKFDMPAIGRPGEPMMVTGTVKLVSDGAFVVSSPMQTGTKANMGKTAVLQMGSADIVVCERHHEPWDLGCFSSVGIDPSQKKYLLLKSRMHYRAAFAPIAQAIVECNGVGVTSSDYGLFKYKQLQRPVFPMDYDTSWPSPV